MRQRLQAVAARFLPEIGQVNDDLRQAAFVSIWGMLYGLPLALIGVAWLIAWTDLAVLRASWAALLALFLLRALLFQFDLSTVLESDSVRVHGALGRLVTWAAVLLFGVSALWLEVIATVGDTLLRQRTPAASTPFMARVRRWDRARFLLIALGRETLSVLPAFWAYQQLGGVVPLPDFSWAALGPALLATAVRSGLFVIVMTPALGLYLLASGRPSPIELLRTFYRFWLAIVIFYLLPDPFGVLAAGLYVAGGWGGFLFFTAFLVMVSFLVHRLNRTALTYQRRVRELSEIEQLTRVLLQKAAPDVDLAALLQRHVPDLLPFSWVEVRLFTEGLLYRSDLENAQQGGGATAPVSVQPALPAAAWERLAASDEPYLVLQQVDAADGRSGLLVPIAHLPENERIGGICVLPHAYDGDVVDFLPATRSLAELVAAVLQQQARFDEALTSQAAAYQEELYAQAYQTEVYAQALAYQKVTQELAVAGQIQTSFLPQQLPEVPGWQLAVTLEPARETSGDFYDIIPLPGGCIGLLVADVADKGIGPALYMALSRTLIRTYAEAHELEPHRVLSETNRRILRDTFNDLFVTVFYAVLDPRTGRIVYCNAGHNPPYVLQAGNGSAPCALGRTAIPLGILEDAEWQYGEILLRPGDVLVMYTDGVTEAQNDLADFFGEERLLDIVSRNRHRSAEAIEDKIVSAIYDFVGDEPQFDDITLMVVVRDEIG
ncbi:MAG: PP2C family protein-serine/threonine phosphatase [Anaerolineales bacterium]|nr:PP2C family protein-serine/threonine phosphatase [Anaerolineales bacterium]